MQTSYQHSQVHIHQLKALHNTLELWNIDQHIYELVDLLLYHQNNLMQLRNFLYNYLHTLHQYNFLHIFDSVDQSNNLEAMYIYLYKTRLYYLQILLFQQDIDLSIFIDNHKNQQDTAQHRYYWLIQHMFLQDTFQSNSKSNYQQNTQQEYQDIYIHIKKQLRLEIVFEYNFLHI